MKFMQETTSLLSDGDNSVCNCYIQQCTYLINSLKVAQRQVRTWRRRGGNSQSPTATRIFTPTMHRHKSPVVQTLWRHISVTPSKKYLSCTTRRRERELHFATLWCAQCDNHLHMLQRPHNVTCGRTAIRLHHQVCRWIWTQAPSTTSTPTCITNDQVWHSPSN